MKRKHESYQKFRDQLLKQPGLREEYDKLQPEFAFVEAMLKARKQNGLTQEQLAQRLGTKQSAIARIESGRTNPTLRMMAKLAKELGTRLEIKFVNV